MIEGLLDRKIGMTQVFGPTGEAIPVTVLEIGPCKRVVADVGDNSVAGIRHFALQVESIEVAKKELEARGVVFTEPVKPAGGGGSVLFFKDAEGNLLHFVERPAGSVFKK